jgi:hypothetical protein
VGAQARLRGTLVKLDDGRRHHRRHEALEVRPATPTDQAVRWRIHQNEPRPGQASGEGEEDGRLPGLERPELVG